MGIVPTFLGMKSLNLTGAAALLLGSGACSAAMPGGLGMTNGKLKPCPSSPNCVSSFADPNDETHHIAPLAVDGDPEVAWERAVTVIKEMPRVTIVTAGPTYLHAEMRSFLFRFVDDVELVRDAAGAVIHWRSASRSGYSDMGVNRKRIEAIREAMQP